MSFTLPDLAYDYNALDSAIDALTMEIHHSKHHNTYVTNLNNALAGSEHEGKDLDDLIRNAGAISPAVRNNGGGHWNHSFFWGLMTPDSMGGPTGELADKIKTTFGDFDQFKTQFTQAGLTRFGSGWAWLIVNAQGQLQITSTPNQDNPLMDIAEVKGSPILGLDVWEHAYYLRYQNRRPDYISAWWDLVNWNKVADLYQLNK